MDKIVFHWNLFWSWLFIHIFVFCVDILILKFPANTMGFIEGNALYFSWFLMGIIAIFVGYIIHKTVIDCKLNLKVSIGIIYSSINALVSFGLLYIIQEINPNYVENFMSSNIKLVVVLFFTSLIFSIYFQNISKIIKKYKLLSKNKKNNLTKNRK